MPTKYFFLGIFNNSIVKKLGFYAKKVSKNFTQTLLLWSHAVIICSKYIGIVWPKSGGVTCIHPKCVYLTKMWRTYEILNIVVRKLYKP